MPLILGKKEKCEFSWKMYYSKVLFPCRCKSNLFLTRLTNFWIQRAGWRTFVVNSKNIRIICDIFSTHLVPILSFISVVSSTLQQQKGAAKGSLWKVWGLFFFSHSYGNLGTTETESFWLRADILLNSLSANPTKWSNTLKQCVCNLPTNCLSVFHHFMGLMLKGLTHVSPVFNFHTSWKHQKRQRPVTWNESRETQTLTIRQYQFGKRSFY